MEKDNKRIIISVIVGFCLISMLIAFFNFVIIFRLRNVTSGSYLGGTLWDLNGNQVWRLIPVLICSATTILILCIISLKEFFSKKSIKNVVEFILLFITTALIVVSAVFTFTFLESMFFLNSSGERINTYELTAYTETFSSMMSFLIPAIIVTIIFFVSVIIKMIKLKKEEQTKNVPENNSQSETV